MVDTAALDQGNGGSAPVRRARSQNCPAGNYRQAHLEGMLPGPVRFQGRVARCVIQNWPHVLSAPRRACRARRRARISRLPAHSLPLALTPLCLCGCSGALRYALAVPPCRRAAVPRSFSLAEAGSQLCPSVR